jgi:hypothetical protein
MPSNLEMDRVWLGTLDASSTCAATKELGKYVIEEKYVLPSQARLRETIETAMEREARNRKNIWDWD